MEENQDDNKQIIRDEKNKKLLIQLIQTGKLSIEQMNNVYEHEKNDGIADAIVQQITNRGSLTEQLSNTETIFGGVDEYALPCVKKISEQVKWSELNFNQLMEVGKNLSNTGNFPMFFWEEICKHIKWEKLNFQQKIDVGTTGMWTCVWEEVAKHIDWTTVTVAKMLEICESSDHRGVVIPIIKTGKLNAEQIMEVLEKMEDDSALEELATDFDWSILAVDDILYIGNRIKSPEVWESIFKHISSLA